MTKPIMTYEQAGELLASLRDAYLNLPEPQRSAFLRELKQVVAQPSATLEQARAVQGMRTVLGVSVLR